VTTSYPAVFTATDTDLGDAFRAIRKTLHHLPEPRLYAAAFVLAALVNRGAVTWWRDWDDAVPVPVAVRGTRGMVESTMWAAFGFPAAAILRPGSAPLVALGNPKRVLVDPFFDPQKPTLLTVVRETPPGMSKGGNSVKVSSDDGAWIWNSSAPSAPLRKAVEYQTGNTFNQQNGVRCALAATTSAAGGGAKAAATYRIERVNCPNYRAGNECAVNGEKCASDGAGGTRISKPRVIVPSAPGADDWLLTPTAFGEMISRARVDKASGTPRPLPKAKDLALITGWAAQGNGQSLDFGRLVAVLGPKLLPVLVDP
jgi:hypothetical protein